MRVSLKGPARDHARSLEENSMKKKTVRIKTYRPITDQQSILDRIVTSFASDPQSMSYLEDCMSFDPDLNRRVPLRYRIIAKSFVTHSSLEEVNERLKKAGCAMLYSRSVWEASLIYAFSKGKSYSEWKELQKLCAVVRRHQDERESDGYFRSGSVKLSDIREYVMDNSSMEEGEDTELASLKTKHLTRALYSGLEQLPDDLEEFRTFLISNIESLSPVREKTRYYFCKYLYSYLTGCRDRYLEARRSGEDEREAQAEIAALKGLTKLTRKKYSDEEAVRILDESGVSFGEIFDAFNYFFFGYVSLDWMEVLLEYYGNIDSLPEEERTQLASSLRKYDAGKYKDLSDEEVLALKQEEIEQKEEMLDIQYKAGSEADNYQRDRAGENTIRKYVKGSLDIDRTTLICFLLFFDSEDDGDRGIDVQRMSEILADCGYAPLRKNDEFDYFVIRYIETDEPVDCLIETVTDYALDEENFFLYRMYRASRSADEDIQNII